jgi:hypothetical protein
VDFAALRCFVHRRKFMPTPRLFRLAALAVALAAPLAACVPSYTGAPYDKSDQFKNSNGTEQNGAPGSGARD